jgi:hypothetical protein
VEKANTLAYCITATITNVKSFIVEDPVVSCSSTVVEHSPIHLKVEGSSPTATAASERAKNFLDTWLQEIDGQRKEY